MRIGDYETHPAADCFPMHDVQRLYELTEDIRANGLLDAIVLHDGKVLDGRNRLRACIDCNAEPRFDSFDGDPVAYVRSKNAMRRDLTADQRRACLVDLEDLEADYRGGDRRSDDFKSETVSDLKPERSVAADNVAKQMGESARTSHKAVIVKKRAPELHEAVKAGKITHNQADQIRKLVNEGERKRVADTIGDPDSARRVISDLRRSKRTEKLAQQSEANAELNEGLGTFPVIYADPPWNYEHTKTESRAIENQYPTMDLDDICALDVASITTDDAVLFCWATSPKLEEALRVINAWGFTYRTNMVWDKERIGMGYYARQQHELLLIATKGSPPAPAPEGRPPSVFRQRRDQKHSKKPEAFALMIARMYPELPKIELFCRSPLPGWVAWGNESGA